MQSYDVIVWCKSVMTVTPARWTSLVRSVPLELLLRQPAPGEWSALECLQHLVEVEELAFPVRIRALLAGQPFPGFDPNANREKLPLTPALAERFEQLRGETLKLLEQVTVADLDKQALHAEYGMVSMRDFLHHIPAHDLNHTVQAERALMQPFIAGCGAWVVNYNDHKVG